MAQNAFNRQNIAFNFSSFYIKVDQLKENRTIDLIMELELLKANLDLFGIKPEKLTKKLITFNNLN